MRLIREHYLQLLRPYYETDLIKVITGVRRAGKSILLECIRDELIQRGVHTDHIIFMNLEDLDYEYIQTASDLHVDIKARINDSGKYYIFLDEIQHIEHFEKALASFRASLNVSIFVTGSNSTLLSGDLSTLLTGRAVEFEVLPFSFSETKEYFEGNGFSFTEEFIFEYLKWGGFSPFVLNFLAMKNPPDDISQICMTALLLRILLKKAGALTKKPFEIFRCTFLRMQGKNSQLRILQIYYNAKKQPENHVSYCLQLLGQNGKVLSVARCKTLQPSGKKCITGSRKILCN